MSKITMDVGAVPATPDSGQVVLYPKSDKLLYQKDEDGLERMVTMAPKVTATLYVDVRRMDSYVEDGTRAWPYKTVMAAVNKIIANADNSTAKVYGIAIQGPCDIVENITLDNALLTDIYIYGDGPFGCVSSTPASGASLSSTITNQNLHVLFIENITFNGAVNLIGSDDASHFLSFNGQFKDCDFYDTVTIQNADGLTFDGGGMQADINIQNVFALFIMRGYGFNGSATVTYNAGANKPSGLTACNLILDACTFTGDITLSDAACTLQARAGARVGSPGGTISVGNGLFTMYASYVRANVIVGASGTLIQRGGMLKEANLTMAGTRTKDVSLGNFLSFKSTEQTGTGSAQNIAHGLGYIPQTVIISVTSDTDVIISGFTVSEGTHDATNVVATVTAGTKYKVVAF